MSDLSENSYTFVESDIWLILRAAGCKPLGSGANADTWEERFEDPTGEMVCLPQFHAHQRREAVMQWLREHNLLPSIQDVLLARSVQESASAVYSTQKLDSQMRGITESIADLRGVLLGQQDPKMIRVWAFYDAPSEFQALSPHGGDEDWLAYVPAGVAERWIPWMDSGSSFGCCDVSEHVLEGGAVIRIGAHS